MSGKRMLVVLAFSIFTLSSCTMLSRIDHLTDAVRIESSDHEIVGRILVEGSTTYFLGLSGKCTEREALDKLQAEKEKLKSNQMLTNYFVTTEVEYVFLGIFINKYTTITADIVEFKK